MSGLLGHSYSVPLRLQMFCDRSLRQHFPTGIGSLWLKETVPPHAGRFRTAVETLKGTKIVTQRGSHSPGPSTCPWYLLCLGVRPAGLSCGICRPSSSRKPLPRTVMVCADRSLPWFLSPGDIWGHLLQTARPWAHRASLGHPWDEVTQRTL